MNRIWSKKKTFWLKNLSLKSIFVASWDQEISYYCRRLFLLQSNPFKSLMDKWNPKDQAGSIISKIFKNLFAGVATISAKLRSYTDSNRINDYNAGLNSFSRSQSLTQTHTNLLCSIFPLLNSHVRTWCVVIYTNLFLPNAHCTYNRVEKT